MRRFLVAILVAIWLQFSDIKVLRCDIFVLHNSNKKTRKPLRL